MTQPPPTTMAQSVWRDLTPLGRWTIGVPLIVMGYATMALLILFLVVLFLLVKLGVIPRLEKSIAGVTALIFKPL